MELPSWSARFWAKVDQSGGPDACWPWTAYCDRYGVFKVERRNVKAHRVAYFLETGEDPPAVLHRCDNPPCCNARHLYAGTQQDNIADMRQKGRARNGAMTGRRLPHFKYSDAQIMEVRHRVAAGEPRPVVAAAFGMHKCYLDLVVRGARRRGRVSA